MPVVTREVAACGFSGLTVVLALRNETIPAMLIPAPRAAMSRASDRRTPVGRNTGAKSARYHIPKPMMKATSGGGIFVSKKRSAFSRGTYSPFNRRRRSTGVIVNERRSRASLPSGVSTPAISK